MIETTRFFIVWILWFFGIHGTTVWVSVAAITTAINLENLVAFQASEVLPNMYANWTMLLRIGGIGSTLGLCILMVFAKSNRYKTLGKMSLLPEIFNINEPVVFGMPIMLNSVLFIPLVLNPVVSGLIAYFGMSSGLVNYSNGLQIPWTTPPLIDGFLRGGVSLMLLQLVILIVVTLMYYPFFKVLDNQEYVKELEVAEEKRV